MYMEKLRKSNCILLDFDVLRWIFLVYINLVFIDKENEVVNGIYVMNGIEDIGEEDKEVLEDVNDW